MGEQSGGEQPLLRMAALELCELVWSDARIIERLKVSTLEDATLEPILAFFRRDFYKVPLDIRHTSRLYFY